MAGWFGDDSRALSFFLSFFLSLLLYFYYDYMISTSDHQALYFSEVGDTFWNLPHFPVNGDFSHPPPPIS